MDDLDRVMEEINAVDRCLLEKLAQRRKLARQVVEIKDKCGAPIRDPLRGEQMLGDLIAQGCSQGLDAHFVTRIFHEIIDDSIRSRQLHLMADSDASDLKRIAFQGIEGAFSELAGRKFFARHLDQAVFLGLSTFEQVVDAVEGGDADYGRIAGAIEKLRSATTLLKVLGCYPTQHRSKTSPWTE